jgi:hypothetical protein
MDFMDALLSSNSSEKSIGITEADFCSEINRICFFSQLDPEVKKWLFELEDSGRLVVAMKAFKAIDRPCKKGFQRRISRG